MATTEAGVLFERGHWPGGQTYQHGALAPHVLACYDASKLFAGPKISVKQIDFSCSAGFTLTGRLALFRAGCCQRPRADEELRWYSCWSHLPLSFASRRWPFTCCWEPTATAETARRRRFNSPPPSPPSAKGPLNLSRAARSGSISSNRPATTKTAMFSSIASESSPITRSPRLRL